MKDTLEIVNAVTDVVLRYKPKKKREKNNGNAKGQKPKKKNQAS